MYLRTWTNAETGEEKQTLDMSIPEAIGWLFVMCAVSMMLGIIIG